jgi:glycosyltransferase involved in cell wall biosynthesis
VTGPAKPVGWPGKLSVIITAHNEGDEVLLTCEDMRDNAGCGVEIIVVDDGSCDHSCESLPDWVKVVRVSAKTGIAFSRNRGMEFATGDAFMFLDAHMRVTPGSPALLAKIASDMAVVAVPGVGALYSTREAVNWRAHFEIVDGILKSKWNAGRPKEEIQSAQTFVAPGWVVSKREWDKMGPWPGFLRNWGSTEVCRSAMAGLCGIPVVACRDAVVWHRFRHRFPYRVRPHGIYWNANVMNWSLFDDQTAKLLDKKRKAVYDRPDFEPLIQSSEFLAFRAEFAARRKVDCMTWLTAALGNSA